MDLFPGNISTGRERRTLRVVCTPRLFTALFKIAKYTDGVNISIHCSTYAHMRNYLTTEKSEILLFVATWVNTDDLSLVRFIRHKEMNILSSHLYIEAKNVYVIE